METTHDRSNGLPDELLDLTAQLGSPATQIEPLAAPDSPRECPAAFRICLANGRQLKACVILNAARAEKVEYILGHLRHPAFPAVVARRGRVMLIEWVDGEPADTITASTDVVHTAATLHAFIHTTPLPATVRYRPADALSAIRDTLRHNLAALAANGILPPSTSQNVLSLGLHFAPARCAVGFVHRDLCATNIVVRPDGEIRVVDNETVSIDALDFDLARTWYRWPMLPTERERYLRTYGDRRDVGDFLAHFPFWSVAVLADSLQLRRDAAPAVRSVPLARLRALLAAADTGVVPERLVFES